MPQKHRVRRVTPQIAAIPAAPPRPMQLNLPPMPSLAAPDCWPPCKGQTFELWMPHQFVKHTMELFAHEHNDPKQTIGNHVESPSEVATDIDTNEQLSAHQSAQGASSYESYDQALFAHSVSVLEVSIGDDLAGEDLLLDNSSQLEHLFEETSWTQDRGCVAMFNMRSGKAERGHTAAALRAAAKERQRQRPTKTNLSDCAGTVLSPSKHSPGSSVQPSTPKGFRAAVASAAQRAELAALQKQGCVA